MTSTSRRIPASLGCIRMSASAPATPGRHSTTRTPTGTNFPFFGEDQRHRRQLRVPGNPRRVVPDPAGPGLSITAEYRFFGVIGDTKFHGAVDTGLTPATYARTFGSGKLGPQTITRRWSAYGMPSTLAPPPPPPAPIAAPAPAPARSYLVFFDWDRADLTDRARQIIHEAAENSTRVQFTRIEVNGYTDTSGTRGLQPAPVGPACAGGRGGTGARRRAPAGHLDPGLRRDASAGADRPQRARAAEPPSGDHHPLTGGLGHHTAGSGRREAPRFL